MQIFNDVYEMHIMENSYKVNESRLGYMILYTHKWLVISMMQLTNIIFI